MKLDDYLKLAASPSLTELSEKVGISKSRLSQLRNSMDWPPELAMLVEEHTHGALDASALSPVIAKARQGLAA